MFNKKLKKRIGELEVDVKEIKNFMAHDRYYGYMFRQAAREEISKAALYGYYGRGRSICFDSNYPDGVRLKEVIEKILLHLGMRLEVDEKPSTKTITLEKLKK
jgi:hypothetical protein